MNIVDLNKKQAFDPKLHVAVRLGQFEEGTVAVDCWEPGQIGPMHVHHDATEINFCYQGGGIMTTDEGKEVITPGSFVIHPHGEYHEFESGPERTLIFRLRLGANTNTHRREWRGNPDWKPEDQP
ncbi:MAG: cupin domain-containing protein [Nitrospinota bacterium]|nr:cupin domain-containing protein [Nitrospinota bacterium]